MKADDIELSVTADSVTISGERKIINEIKMQSITDVRENQGSLTGY
jgi:HSP20 family molecular chaperone IbpA